MASLVGVLPWVVTPAAPLAEPAQREAFVLDAAELVQATESPVDVHGWIQRETTLALLDGATDADRLALLRQGWKERSPTWIQDAVVVNLGDFPTLDHSSERAERDLKTLEWVLEQQRRQAAGQPREDNPDAAPQDNWLRSLIPRQWIAVLKANREWVAAGGTALLIVVWGTAAFARRPTAGPVVVAPPPPPEPRVRRRRRYRDHRDPAGTTG
jgi:hypothetical protein